MRHQIGHPVQRAVAPRRRDPHRQRPGQVDLARADRAARAARRPAGVSPVSSERSISLVPSATTPSTGIRPPGRTRTRSPDRQLGHGTVLLARRRPAARRAAPPARPAPRPRSGRWRGCGDRDSGPPAGRRSARSPRRNRRVRRHAPSRRATCRAASRIASVIGTSMFSRPPRSAAQALRKKGWPEKAMAGSAIAAEIQWNMSRVASAAPDQTATDSSMTFIAAKPATRQPHQQLAALRGRSRWRESVPGVQLVRLVADAVDRLDQLARPSRPAPPRRGALQRQVDPRGTHARVPPPAPVSTVVMQPAQWMRGQRQHQTPSAAGGGPVAASPAGSAATAPQSQAGQAERPLGGALQRSSGHPPFTGHAARCAGWNGCRPAPWRPCGCSSCPAPGRPAP